MTATYTVDVFSSLDGYGANTGDWGGYWGKQGPELLHRRLDLFEQDLRMVYGATTHRAFAGMLASGEVDALDPWVTRMREQPTTVISHTLVEPLDWPDAEVRDGDAVEIVRRMKAESDVPLRSHGSLSLNRALMAVGLVDLLQVTIFPVITASSGVDPVYAGGADFDLELLEHRILDGRTHELLYRPTLH